VTDELVGAIALMFFALILGFIGFWFGWSTVLWIVGASFVLLLVSGLISRLRR
jgi:hypothetical protein